MPVGFADLSTELQELICDYAIADDYTVCLATLPAALTPESDPSSLTGTFVSQHGLVLASRLVHNRYHDAITRHVLRPETLIWPAHPTMVLTPTVLSSVVLKPELSEAQKAAWARKYEQFA